jgi:regulator of sigma E protease
LGMYLIAAGEALNIVWYIVQVAIALGAVIFVHELGHFLVAKACGVKCEKFYVGFDVPIKIGPLRLPAALWRKQWGETEYGIGILPLGGYVKMLGQDDNPSRITEEMQRSQVSGQATNAKEIVGPSGETYLVDRRSYLAKSVPQRMAIISAGVVMNVIFAFLFAVVAYGVGVPTIPCIVSQTIPGSPAWQADLEPGDEIVAIADKQNPTFDDLRSNVTLGDLENGIRMHVDEAGESGAPREIVLKPTRGVNQGLATIGIAGPQTLRLDEVMPVFPFSPAARAERVPSGEGASDPAGKAPEGFLAGDEIVRVRVAGQEEVHTVGDYREFSRLLSAHLSDPLEVTVRRGGEKNPADPYGPRSGGEYVTVRIEPRPLKRLGLDMEMGKIVAVQQNSPAAEAIPNVSNVDRNVDRKEEPGIQEGDFLQSVDGQQIEDPITLPYELRRRALEAAEKDETAWVKLVVSRPSSGGGEEKPVPFDEVRLRVPQWLDKVSGPNSPVDCAPLGVAYHVLNRVDRVIPDSPAAKAGLRSGDLIVQVEILKGKDDERDLLETKIEFDEQKNNWPLLMETIQGLSPETSLKLTVVRDDETLVKELKPYVPAAEDGTPMYFDASRGFNFDEMRHIRQAGSFAEQISMGFDKTVDSLLLVYRFLEKLITTQVPVTALGGPITIAKATYYSAFEGFGRLLIFLTILSANLAVINFLPIPLLDGGHMVFLAYEGIKRRPPNERFVVAMHTIGFVFIISLMLFVIVLDLGLIKRNL